MGINDPAANSLVLSEEGPRFLANSVFLSFCRQLPLSPVFYLPGRVLAGIMDGWPSANSLPTFCGAKPE